jgi:hypothetical protein
MHKFIAGLSAALFLLGLAGGAFAQADAEGGAEGKAPAYSNFDAGSFSIELPQQGEVLTPQSEGWDNEAEVTFEWYGAESDPVSLIQGRVDDLGAAIDEATFGVFCASLLENWSADGDKFDVVTSNKTMPIGGLKWNLIEIADSSDPKNKVYYSVFSTFSGTKIYTISLYYLKPLSAAVQDFGKPVIQSFQAK